MTVRTWRLEYQFFSFFLSFFTATAVASAACVCVSMRKTANERKKITFFFFLLRECFPFLYILNFRYFEWNIAFFFLLSVLCPFVSYSCVCVCFVIFIFIYWFTLYCLQCLHICIYTQTHIYTKLCVHDVHERPQKMLFIEFQSTDYYTLEALYVTVHSNNNYNEKQKKELKTNKYRAMSSVFLMSLFFLCYVFVYLFTFFSCMYFGYCSFSVSFVWLELKQLLLLLLSIFLKKMLLTVLKCVW